MYEWMFLWHKEDSMHLKINVTFYLKCLMLCSVKHYYWMQSLNIKFSLTQSRNEEWRQERRLRMFSNTKTGLQKGLSVSKALVRAPHFTQPFCLGHKRFKLCSLSKLVVPSWARDAMTSFSWKDFFFVNTCFVSTKLFELINDKV